MLWKQGYNLDASLPQVICSNCCFAVNNAKSIQPNRFASPEEGSMIIQSQTKLKFETYTPLVISRRSKQRTASGSKHRNLCLRWSLLMAKLDEEWSRCRN